MLYELRVYEVTPGKMKQLVDRFANITIPLFKKHGVKPVLFLEPLIGTSNEFTYILEWNSLAEREKNFGSFSADPEWLAAKAATETDGPLALRTHSSILKEVPSCMAALGR